MLRFKRYIKHQTSEMSPRRIAAAQRAINKDKEQYALFPELVRFNTPAKRLQARDQFAADAVQARRDHRASNWIEARNILRSMSPLTRQGALRWWNQGTGCPGDPEYLLDFLRRVQSGRESGWSKLRRLRQITLVGSGVLPRCTVFSDPVHTPCNIHANPKKVFPTS